MTTKTWRSAGLNTVSSVSLILSLALPTRADASLPLAPFPPIGDPIVALVRVQQIEAVKIVSDLGHIDCFSKLTLFVERGYRGISSDTVFALSKNCVLKDNDGTHVIEMRGHPWFQRPGTTDEDTWVAKQEVGLVQRGSPDSKHLESRGDFELYRAWSPTSMNVVSLLEKMKDFYIQRMKVDFEFRREEGR